MAIRAADLLSVSPVLVDRVRITIMANLCMANGPVEFTTLVDELGLTKGNLSTHLRKLEDAGLIAVKKAFVDRKSRTTYVCTAQGKKEVYGYLATIEAFLKAAT